MAEGTTYRNEVRTEMQILNNLDKDEEGENIDPDFARKTEDNFYRGAPPLWLNFYLAEQNTDEGQFIKRDGYDDLLRQILSKNSGARLNHKPGSGGTTLAMQLLWDLGKSFRCSVLLNSDLESLQIATAVIDRYTAGEPNDHKTVLLLVQDGNVNTLQESFVAELAKRKIDSDKPVVVILNCVRIAHINAEHSAVNLNDQLTDNEKQHFDDKKEWLEQKYTKENGSQSFPDITPKFHGFNIMQNNFSQDYVKQAWDACGPLVPNHGLKLTACLCLLNSYVPGSFVLKSHFERNCTLEETRPFRHLMVSFNNESVGHEVLRMAHPMIAEQGTQLLGVDRSKMAQILLKELCTKDHTLFISAFIKDLLTKRQKDDSGKLQSFSRLILDIKTGNARTECLSVLKKAVNIFPQIVSYPQTLSRFYYLVIGDFYNARRWALTAKQIAPHNSFIADTLGQVYKHFLKRKVSVLESNRDTLLEVLDLAKKAFEAFEHGEILAEKEQENRDGMRQQSKIFNYRPKIAYLQVANNLFHCKDKIKCIATSVNQYRKYEKLIFPLSNQIKERARFINMLLSYSKKSFNEQDPDYVLTDARTCFKDYTGEALPEGLGTGNTEDQLRLLHENWQNDTQEPGLNLKMMVKSVKSSFHETHEKYFRSRYLLPLLYLESDKKVYGEVRCYKVYTTVRGEEIELDVDPPHLALWRSGTVSFHLRFTIRGPTAYDIQYQDSDEEAKSSSHRSY